MGHLAHIVYKPLDTTSAGDGYLRVPLETAKLVAGHGIEGDAKGGANSRHVNIMSANALAGLADEGFLTQPGQMGEQLIVDGLDVNALPVGSRLRIGEEAVIELTEPRTGCAVFEKHQEKQRQDAAGRLGMMASVVLGGAISVGDGVCVVDAEAD